MTDKLTDSEIVKALEDALYRIKGAEHLIVPKEGVDNLCNGLEYALDLINRLQAQNKDLAETVHNLTIEKDALFDKVEELKVEIERLKPFEDKFAEFKSHIRVEDMLVCANSLDEWLEFCDNLKAEAYKEFAERLKKHRRIEHQWVVPETAIDNILKELVGENK